MEHMLSVLWNLQIRPSPLYGLAFFPPSWSQAEVNIRNGMDLASRIRLRLPGTVTPQPNDTPSPVTSTIDAMSGSDTNKPDENTEQNETRQP